jgi:hypothetical protein
MADGGWQMAESRQPEQLKSGTVVSSAIRHLPSAIYKQQEARK